MSNLLYSDLPKLSPEARYSPRQISEVYKSCGLNYGMEETQNGKLYSEVKDALACCSRNGTIVICCGWNSSGFGRSRGFSLHEILLVAHGGAHNDTIVTVETKDANLWDSQAEVCERSE